jgi:hypothetical protein
MKTIVICARSKTAQIRSSIVETHPDVRAVSIHRDGLRACAIFASALPAFVGGFDSSKSARGSGIHADDRPARKRQRQVERNRRAGVARSREAA